MLLALPTYGMLLVLSRQNEAEESIACNKSGKALGQTQPPCFMRSNLKMRNQHPDHFRPSAWICHICAGCTTSKVEVNGFMTCIINVLAASGCF